MNEPIRIGRRRVLLRGAIGGAALALGRTASATEVRLEENDPQALALGYYEDADAVDLARWPRKAQPENQVCSSCVLYRVVDDEWGGCAIFPGKLVKGAGWCNAWAAKG
jgi:hypothetical protein